MATLKDIIEKLDKAESILKHAEPGGLQTSELSASIAMLRQVRNEVLTLGTLERVISLLESQAQQKNKVPPDTISDLRDAADLLRKCSRNLRSWDDDPEFIKSLYDSGWGGHEGRTW